MQQPTNVTGENSKYANWTDEQSTTGQELEQNIEMMSDLERHQPLVW